MGHCLSGAEQQYSEACSFKSALFCSAALNPYPNPYPLIGMPLIGLVCLSELVFLTTMPVQPQAKRV